jgi:sec-independent protein translocase protein TatA
MPVIIPLAFIGSVGSPELLIIFAVVLLVFGPKELPRIVKLIARALNELRSVSDDFRSEIMSIDVDPIEADPIEHDAEETVPEDDEAHPEDDVLAEDEEDTDDLSR